jgi:hypothetical protein
MARRAQAGATTPPAQITTVAEALRAADPRPAEDAAQAAKKNYAERLSRHLATCVANALRPRFPGVTPDPFGRQHEAPARTAKGVKKLDVNYSTPQLGLALGVSLKTINFRDPATQRYTKNYTRADNELRAEATDYHQRQPYAVLVGALFLPFDSCDDAGTGPREELNVSSFGQAVRILRPRANRTDPRDDADLFERVFIALYEPVGERLGDVRFFDVMSPPPRDRRPVDAEVLTFEQWIREVETTYAARNDPEFRWAQTPARAPRPPRSTLALFGQRAFLPRPRQRP